MTTPSGRDSDPADSQARLRRAQALLDLDRAAEARPLCAAAVAADPGDTAGWRLLSQCCLDLGEPGDGVHAADQALAADPNDASALRLRVLGLIRLAEHGGTGREVAVQAAWAAMRADPDHWYGHALLSRATLPPSGNPMAGNQPPICYQAAYRARELAPHHADAHFTMGRAADDLGRDDEARACYRTALALDPGHVAARNNLGRLQLKQGHVKQALACFVAVAAGDHRLLTDAGIGAHNLRVVTMRLLSPTRWISLTILIAALLVSVQSTTPAAATPSPALRGAAIVLSLGAWAAWAQWARTQLPPGLAHPLLRLGKASSAVCTALLGVTTGTVVGLLLLCVPPLDAAGGPLAFLGAAVQAVAIKSARTLARKERQDP